MATMKKAAAIRGAKGGKAVPIMPRFSNSQIIGEAPLGFDFLYGQWIAGRFELVSRNLEGILEAPSAIGDQDHLEGLENVGAGQKGAEPEPPPQLRLPDGFRCAGRQPPAEEYGVGEVHVGGRFQREVAIPAVLRTGALSPEKHRLSLPQRVHRHLDVLVGMKDPPRVRIDQKDLPVGNELVFAVEIYEKGLREVFDDGIGFGPRFGYSFFCFCFGFLFLLSFLTFFLFDSFTLCFFSLAFFGFSLFSRCFFFAGFFFASFFFLALFLLALFLFKLAFFFSCFFFSGLAFLLGNLLLPLTLFCLTLLFFFTGFFSFFSF